MLSKGADVGTVVGVGSEPEGVASPLVNVSADGLGDATSALARQNEYAPNEVTRNNDKKSF